MVTEAPVQRPPDDGSDLARAVQERIEKKFRDEQLVFDRMDGDFDLWTLEPWTPGDESHLAKEDIFTTNEPRVLAQKVIAFITGTELIVRISNDDAQEQQEEVNDRAEQLAIGMLRAADERLVRSGRPAVKHQLAFFSTVRGNYAAVRALLRKTAQGTVVDMLPLDPRHLVVEWGEDEPAWAAYRMTRTRGQLRADYPEYEEFASGDDAAPEFIYEYSVRIGNSLFDPLSFDPFIRRKNIYLMGTICQGRWLKPLHDVYTLHFPVVAAPVDAQPQLSPSERGETTYQDFGESIFAENRNIWSILNRAASYTIDLTRKASDPRKKVFSSDGTMTLEEGASEAGAEIPLATGNQEDIENFEEADISRAAALNLQVLQRATNIGGLPDQAYGILDKPLSAVALRQLGNNLEHKVTPRMNALTACVEMSLQNLLEQYETGGFDPFPVSGRRLDSTRFAGKVILPEMVSGFDPIEVSMQLALPEDLSTIWSIAGMAMTPTATGEPLASLEWTREHILRMPSHKVIHGQNLEAAARMQDELAQTLELYKAAVEEGDEPLAAILYDKLRIAALQRQVEGSLMMQQLQMMAAGIMPPPRDSGVQNGQGTPRRGSRQQNNPANGAIGVAQVRGIGNQASPQAGWNTPLPRNGRERTP
jgi:hypothetical protein